MPQSLSAVYIHLVFSTKHREPFLQNPNLRAATHAYLGGISKQLDCPPLIVGGVADHVHLMARFGRGRNQSDWVKELKRVSSIWVKTQKHTSPSFSWQAGYGAFSVSVSQLGAVRGYIEHQEEHHRELSFQDEFRSFLRKHEVDWDERYVWD